MCHRLLPFLLALLLAACAGNAPRSPVEAQADHAHGLYQAGQYHAAADLYQALAAQAGGERRSLYLLLAADSLLQAGEEDKGRALLQQLNPESLPPEGRERLRLLQARFALEDQDAERALALLQGLEESGEPEIARRALALRARAHALQGDALAQARDLMALDQRLRDDSRRLLVQLELLSLLVRQPPEVLRSRLPADGVGQGWVQLAGLVRSFPNDPEGVAASYREWRSLFPDHPALPQLLPRWYQEQRRLAPAELHRVAVLLPEKGPFAPAAAAIRAGILAAWQATPGERRPLLTFHDSSDPLRLWPLLNQVAQSGADMVIGPLTKQNVLQLARAGSLPLPVLALNQTQSDVAPPANLYQYALSPEEEARQAALWAAAQGLGLPGVLYPENGLGRRLLQAFQEQWQPLGRGAIRTQAYHPAEKDYSAAVASLLDIPRLKAEHERREKAAGEKLPFEPELPVDFVYAIGNHDDLLQLRPLVRFHHGSKLPVLGLSRAWKGRLTRDEALDLQGLQLPEIPWLAQPDANQAPLSSEEARRLFPESFRRYPRLIAMGMDAYRLLPQLNRLSVPGQPPMAGATGELSLDNRHLVHRRLTWIELGEPVRVLGLTPLPESLDSSRWEPAVPETEILPSGHVPGQTPSPAQR